MSIDHNDPDVRLAAEALGDMAKGIEQTVFKKTYNPKNQPFC